MKWRNLDEQIRIDSRLDFFFYKLLDSNRCHKIFLALFCLVLLIGQLIAYKIVWEILTHLLETKPIVIFGSCLGSIS